MKKFALLGGVLMALAASPALGQAGGVPAPAAPGASAAGGAANRLDAPDRDAGAYAQKMMDRQGRLSADFAKTAKRAAAYRTQLEQFSAQSADRRTEAYSLRDAARGGQAVGLSAKVIRDALASDMEYWRKEIQNRSRRVLRPALRDPSLRKARLPPLNVPTALTSDSNCATPLSPRRVLQLTLHDSNPAPVS